MLAVRKAFGSSEGKRRSKGVGEGSSAGGERTRKREKRMRARSGRVMATLLHKAGEGGIGAGGGIGRVGGGGKRLRWKMHALGTKGGVDGCGVLADSSADFLFAVLR
jgi:hypothetical protein